MAGPLFKRGAAQRQTLRRPAQRGEARSSCQRFLKYFTQFDATIYSIAREALSTLAARSVHP